MPANKGPPHTRYHRLIYLPEKVDYQNSGNSYTENMVHCWAALGFAVVPVPRTLREKLAAFWVRRQTVGVVNWLDNSLVSDGRPSLRGLFIFISTAIKLRLVCKTVVFVRHNLYPHNTLPKHRRWITRFLDCAEWALFSKAMVHSARLSNPSRAYVPHPAYRFIRPGMAHQPSYRLVFFGSVVRYKQLERLVEAWQRTDVSLLIAGQADATYVRELKALAGDKNIQFVEGALTDDDARDLLRTCDAVVIPFASGETIVSGSLYFALSCGVPVICCDSRHAQELVEAGVPGVVHVPDIAALHTVDLQALRQISPERIQSEVQAQFGTEAVGEALLALLQ